MHHSPFLRAPASPKPNSQPSRKPSIVELLSSPPPLPQTPDISVSKDDEYSFSLSRNTSVSSKASAGSSTTSNDWSEVQLRELAESNKLVSINSSYSIQKAFETLINNNLTSVPVSLLTTNSRDLSNCLTFDYSDLNTYLLLLMNRINLNELPVSEIGHSGQTLQQKHELIESMVAKGKKGEEVPVDFIVKLHPKNPFLKFDCNDTLLKVTEVLGNGVHRVAITSENSIVGVLSQRRLIKYMWENARRFPSLDFYLNSTIQDLKIGSEEPITIYEDQHLIEALHKMFMERVSSLAVIDRNKLLIGNISIVDVKNVSSTKNSHLLFKSVLNFISYNLTQKGIERGQDQFPIFHINKQTSLGRVIAKLVATQSHRLWVVENRPSVSHKSVSGSVSGPSGSISGASSASDSPTTVEAALKSTNSATADHPLESTPSISSESNGRPGKLVGVVTLTDILGLFAQSKVAHGKRIDPQFARNQRRRSSTSTTRSSFEAPDPASPDIFRKAYVGKGDSVFSKE